MNDIFFKEVEDDVRRERWQRFWRQFGNKIVVVSIAILLTTAGYVYVEKMQHTKNAEVTALLLQGQTAFRNGDYAKAGQLFSDANEIETNQLALLWAGHNAAISGDSKNAIAYFAQLKSLQKNGLSDYAAIVNDVLQGTVPEGTDITVDSGTSRPFNYARYEMVAVHALDAGDNDLANTYLNFIRQDPNAPPTMKARAQLLQTKISSITKEDALEEERDEVEVNE